jgi:hypothetical protein
VLGGATGEIVEAVVIMERDDPSRSRGFGFVTYADGDAAQAAVLAMNGEPIDGRPIRCNIAGEDGGGGGGRGGGRGGGGGSGRGGGRGGGWGGGGRGGGGFGGRGGGGGGFGGRGGGGGD